MDWVRNARKPTELFVLRVGVKHLSVSALLLPAMMPAFHRAYAFLSMDDVETSRGIGCYRAVFDSVGGSFSALSRRDVIKKAITCTSSGFRKSFLSTKNSKPRRRSFAVLDGWANASALLMEVLTQLNTPFTFVTKSLLRLFRLVQSTLSGGEALRAELKPTL